MSDATRTRGLSAAEIHPLARLPEEWREVLQSAGEAPYRAGQVFKWLHGRGVLDPDAMTDLSKSLRKTLAESGLEPPGDVVHVHRSSDGTRKLVLEMARGARVECVIIPMTARQDTDDADAGAAVDEGSEDDADAGAQVEERGEGDDATAADGAPHAAASSEERDTQRVTLCISTQFGCAMGCVFCASGQAGLVRGLGASEIVYQVLLARQYLEPNEELKNLVFMGMGEPLHHYEETARAIRLLTHADGGGMSPRRITVSTVGLVPGIRRLGEDFGGKVGLAISLHAPNDAVRDRIIPMNSRYPMAELLAALRAYPLPRRRRITIEYTLMAGVNDDVSHADELARILRGLPVKVNLIPMNSIEASELSAPSAERVRAFRERMAERAYSCFVRTRRGDDVSAACGQLAMNQAVVPLGRKPTRTVGESEEVD